MWIEVPSGDMWPDTFLLTCECGSLDLDWYCSGPTVEDEFTLAVVCRLCLKTGSINLPSCGSQSGRVR